MLVFCKGIIAAPSFENSGRSWQSVGGADTEYQTKKVCIDYWHIIQDIDTTPPVLSWTSISWIPWCFFDGSSFVFFNREKTLFSSSFNFTWGQQKHMVYTTPGSLTARPWKMMVWKHTFPIWGKNNFSGAMSIQTVLVGGWTNPSQKYARQIGSFPEVSGWKEKIFELPPPMVFFGGALLSYHYFTPRERASNSADI